MLSERLRSIFDDQGLVAQYDHPLAEFGEGASKDWPFDPSARTAQGLPSSGEDYISMNPSFLRGCVSSSGGLSIQWCSSMTLIKRQGWPKSV
jgi:hypothetical protein